MPIAALAIVTGLVVFSACGGSSTPVDEQLAGIVRTPYPDVQLVSLPDADGVEHNFQAEDDGLLLVYFGYTSCPDVCPTTMSDVSAALGLMGDKADKVQVAMATVDPGRDTGDILEKYVTAFVPDGIALRTDDATALKTAADAFGASYEVTTTDDGDIEVSHTPYVYVVDDQGQLRDQWNFGTTDDDMAHDMELLL
ncbi:MAG: SCO family protein [Actinobacteria bacterium]|nr:SCO family protein [Actinomycetota bacterium]